MFSSLRPIQHLFLWEPKWKLIVTNRIVYRLAPYERRVIELLRNSKDKRARKLAKKRVCSQPFPKTCLDIMLTLPLTARYIWPC
jgi:hypothetical protein